MLFIISLSGLMVLFAASPTRAGKIKHRSSTSPDSNPKKQEGFVGIAVGRQALNGNDYLETLLTRYTDAGTLNSGMRYYFVLGAVWRGWTFEWHIGYFHNKTTTTYVSDIDGTFTFYDLSTDFWVRRQYAPLAAAPGLRLTPGLAIGLNLPELLYEPAGEESEALVTGPGAVLAFGLAVDYRRAFVSAGLEYQYRMVNSFDAEATDIVTLPGEAKLDLSGNSLYITCKFYFDDSTFRP